MTRILTPTLCTLLITLGPSLWGCGGLSDDDDDSAGGGGDSYEVEVTFDGSSVMVDLYDLPVSDDTVGEVGVADVIGTAGVAGPEGYTYGFIASDGYAKDGYAWDDASQATIVQAAGDLQWPEELGMEGADHVNGVVQIDLTAI